MDLQRKVLGLQSKIFKKAFQNCIVSVQKTFWRSKENLRIFWFLIGFGYWAKTFGFPSKRIKLFGRERQICILRAQRNTIKKNVILRTLSFWSFFWSLRETFSAFGEKFQKVLWKLFIPVHGISSRKNLFLTKIFSYKIFFGQGAKLSGLLANLSDMVVTTAFYFSVRKLWRKTIFK